MLYNFYSLLIRVNKLESLPVARFHSQSNACTKAKSLSMKGPPMSRLLALAANISAGANVIIFFYGCKLRIFVIS